MSKPSLLFRWPLVTLGTLLVINVYVFRRFGISYVGWFIAYGPLLNLLASVLSIAWGDLNTNKDLISSRPRFFVASNLLLVALQWQVLGHEGVTVGKRLQDLGALMRTHSDDARRRTGEAVGDLADALGLLVTGGLMLLALLAWALIVVPLQYWVVLLAGAPARLSLKAPTKIIARMNGVNLEVKEVDVAEQNDNAWWTASLSATPVTATNVGAALVLFVTSVAVDWLQKKP